ncbi:regulatory protein RecX [Gulosibacter chungangensis]|uniref:Regulatory protein RecX n=1 Tax=Gulosibacter chungangensis TaxID=979746 RepID=A0A7J5BAG8_9MICO|nr:regulatory protein RecX [Gulosibacter chungangensis]KAB1641873.1 RecX family transcriptional regulator [Gulosibacter chungangensis]
MNEEQDGLAEVIAFPGFNTSNATAPGERESHLAQLRAKMLETAAENEPNPAPSTKQGTPERSGPQFRPKSDNNVARMPGIAEHDEADVEEASDLLVRALARSPKSVREAEEFLANRTELGPREREPIVNRMIDLGYLDDASLAEQLVSGALSRKGLGRGGMSRELRKRGITDEIIQTVLGDFDGSEEFDRALELARERASRFRGLDYETAQRRLYGYLARRGFGGDIVGRAVKAALE